MFVCTFAHMYIWIYTGEVNAKRIREKYLRAVLRQDIAFFDNVGAGEVATRIQTDTRQLLNCFSPSADLSPSRLGTTRNIRKSVFSDQFLRRFRYWFCTRLLSILASFACPVCNASLYWYHWCHHEQVHFRLHAVCVNLLRYLYYLNVLIPDCL